MTPEPATPVSAVAGGRGGGALLALATWRTTCRCSLHAALQPGEGEQWWSAREGPNARACDASRLHMLPAPRDRCWGNVRDTHGIEPRRRRQSNGARVSRGHHRRPDHRYLSSVLARHGSQKFTPRGKRGRRQQDRARPRRRTPGAGTPLHVSPSQVNPRVHDVSAGHGGRSVGSTAGSQECRGRHNKFSNSLRAHAICAAAARQSGALTGDLFRTEEEQSTALGRRADGPGARP